MLGLKRRHCNKPVTGLSQTLMSKTKGSVKCTIVPHESFKPVIMSKPIILPRITGYMPLTHLISDI